MWSRFQRHSKTRCHVWKSCQSRCSFSWKESCISYYYDGPPTSNAKRRTTSANALKKLPLFGASLDRDSHSAAVIEERSISWEKVPRKDCYRFQAWWSVWALILCLPVLIITTSLLSLVMLRQFGCNFPKAQILYSYSLLLGSSHDFPQFPPPHYYQKFACSFLTV